MKSTELRDKTVEELGTLSQEYRRKLFDLRFQHYTGQLQNTAELRAARRTVARIETVLRERELSQQAAK